MGLEEWDKFLDAYNSVMKKREELIDFIVDNIDNPQYIVDHIKEHLDGESVSDSIFRTEIEPSCEERVG